MTSSNPRIPAVGECWLETEEILASGAYLDRYELTQDLRFLPSAEKPCLQLYAPPNIEAPTSASPQLIVHTFLPLTPSSGDASETAELSGVLDIPIHFRYRAAVNVSAGESSRQSTPLFPPHRVSLLCRSAASDEILRFQPSVDSYTAVVQSSQDASCGKQDSGDCQVRSRSFMVLQQWQPVGDLQHMGMVWAVTQVTLFLVMAVLILEVLRK